MIFIAGTAISTFLAILLISKRNKNKADWILLMWFSANSLHQFLIYFDISGFSAQYPFWLGMNIPFPLLYGPLLFLYVSAFVNRLPDRKIFYSLHFIPFIISYIIFLPFYLSPPSVKIFNLTNSLIHFANGNLINYYTILTSGFVYVSLSLWFIKQYHRENKVRYNHQDKINFHWLLILVIGMLLIWIGVYFGSLKHIFILVILKTTLIGIFGIRHTAFFADKTFSGIDLKDKMSAGNDIRYEKSGLTVGKKQLIYAGLHKLMTEEKIFNNSNLSLDLLAARLNIHPNYLSQYLNEEVKLSFNDYINIQRVEEFKKIVQLPECHQYTFLALAYECGFNSKASFNRNFKKATGFTPSEYLGRHLAISE